MNQLPYPDNFPKPIIVAQKVADEVLREYRKRKNWTKDEFLDLAKKCSSDNNMSPVPLWALFFIYFKKNQLNIKLKELLKIKTVRSWSGVVPVSIFTKSFGCPARCVFCPTEARVPKSYFSDEPAVMRAIRNKYDPFKQVISRLTQLFLSGHTIDKIELIIQGGTFSAINQRYRENFVKRSFDAANTDVEKLLLGNQPTSSKKSLRQSQLLNEKSHQRIIGVTVETRPDWCTKDEIKFLRKLGVTRIELGVQSLQEKVLTLNKRGHGLDEVIRATKDLKNAGFKICFHMMPGLPGATLESDIKDFQTLFSNPDFQPDLLKIYPCVVTRDAELTKWYEEKKYVPFNDDKLIKLLLKVKKIIPPYVRILRLVRDIPANDIIAGSKMSNLRQEVEKELHKNNLKCRCVRCREVKLGNIKNVNNLKLRVIEYLASEGKEFFLEYIDPNSETLFALLRLRFPSKNSQPLFAVLKDSSLIREVHTYGQALSLGKSKINLSQHRGLGQKLIAEAEKISQKHGYKKIAVISGVGTREYYRKFGYRLSQTYMIKNLS